MNTGSILLVDDDDSVASMTERALTLFGYEVIRARNGREALAAYDPRAIQLVLTDLAMPEMGGIELIATLRKAHPEVKVIAMSGGSGQGSPEAHLDTALDAGATSPLVKPFSLEELRRAIERCLKEA